MLGLPVAIFGGGGLRSWSANLRSIRYSDFGFRIADFSPSPIRRCPVACASRRCPRRRRRGARDQGNLAETSSAWLRRPPPAPGFREGKTHDPAKNPADRCDRSTNPHLASVDRVPAFDGFSGPLDRLWWPDCGFKRLISWHLRRDCRIVPGCTRRRRALGSYGNAKFFPRSGIAEGEGVFYKGSDHATSRQNQVAIEGFHCQPGV